MQEIFETIIIGGGPSGVTSGIYAARKKLKTLLITRDFFGQIAKTYQVDNWPGEMAISGIDLAKRFETHLKKFEITVQELEEVVKITKQDEFFLVETKSQKVFQGKTIILALGKKPKRLDVPGEKELEGKGVCFCSVCDAPFFQDKRVAVVGGGNAGLEAVLDLTRYADEIFLFEANDKLAGDELLLEQAQQTGKVKLYLNSQVKEIKGDKKVEEIVFTNRNNNQQENMKVDGVFVQIGSSPATNFLKNFLELNERGEININPVSLVTSVEGVFAAGDATNIPYKQVVIAAGEGAKAALAAYKYLVK